jgi:hypothetical protein
MLHRRLTCMVFIAAITLAGCAGPPPVPAPTAATLPTTSAPVNTATPVTPVANTTRDTNHNADPANPYPRTRAGNFFR